MRANKQRAAWPLFSCMLVAAFLVSAPALALTALPSSSAPGAASAVCAPRGVRNAGLENAHRGISAFLVRFALLRCAGEAWNHALSRACVYGGPPWFVVHRYYDPATGRYLQTDPLDVDVNPYAYAANNPLSFTDPEGMCAARVLGDAAQIVGAATALLAGGGFVAAAFACYSIYTAMSDIFDAIGDPVSFAENMAGLTTNWATNKGLGVLGGVAGRAASWARGKLGSYLGGVGASAVGLVGGGGKAAFRAGGGGRPIGQTTFMVRSSSADAAAPKVLRELREATKNPALNSVRLRSPNAKVRIDLAGQSHHGMATPHTQTLTWGPSIKDPAGSPMFQKTTRPTSAADLRIVRRAIKKIKQGLLTLPTRDEFDAR